MRWIVAGKENARLAEQILSNRQKVLVQPYEEHPALPSEVWTNPPEPKTMLEDAAEATSSFATLPTQSPTALSGTGFAPLQLSGSFRTVVGTSGWGAISAMSFSIFLFDK